MTADKKEEVKTKDENEKHYFQEIKDIAQIEKAILELVIEKSDLHTWKSGETNLESYSIKAYQSDTRSLIMDPSGSFLSSITGSALLNKAVLFKAAAGKFIYFGNGTLTRDPVTKEYRIGWFEPFFQSQQRSNYRISFGPENIIKIHLNGEIFNALDLSAGGISIAVSKTRMEEFDLSKSYLKCKVSFNNMNFEVPKVEVKVHKPYIFPNGDPGIQVGMAFHDLFKAQEQVLARYINSQARYQEIRKSIGSR